MNKYLFKPLLLVANMMLFPTWSLASNGELSLHLDCPAVSESCIKINFVSVSSKAIIIKKEPEMVFNKMNILEAEVLSHENDQKQVLLKLGDKAAKELGRVTGNNIGKRLVVVTDDKAITAPIIRGSINGGSFVIATESGNGDSYLDGLSWLKEMSENKATGDQQRSLFSILTYLLLGVLMLGGSIYFAFFRKRLPPEKVS